MNWGSTRLTLSSFLPFTLDSSPPKSLGYSRHYLRLATQPSLQPRTDRVHRCQTYSSHRLYAHLHQQLIAYPCQQLQSSIFDNGLILPFVYPFLIIAKYYCRTTTVTCALYRL
ncbi:hypothetical protein BDQ12DRAFT_524117 [Crucibulum laeve]|uniref:Uncharacterized protein n=1 Tax=Crucibulum laeve TaxID=68775 RepID=A0A5C3LK01_9AGAR|nr:hypothetical protein BDQ12DRAFT_524117 [Crucibulum laeve]